MQPLQTIEQRYGTRVFGVLTSTDFIVGDKIEEKSWKKHLQFEANDYLKNILRKNSSLKNSKKK